MIDWREFAEINRLTVDELLIEAIDKCLDKLPKTTELLRKLLQSHANDLSELNKLLGK